jgi:hypothetical protein
MSETSAAMFGPSLFHTDWVTNIGLSVSPEKAIVATKIM